MELLHSNNKSFSPLEPSDDEESDELEDDEDMYVKLFDFLYLLCLLASPQLPTVIIMQK